jgi:pimeloyl-ACP methyl ester carboxylesterase
MKMKLAQRLALKYYSTKLNTIGWFNPKRAAASAFELFCTPYSGKPKRTTPPVFTKGKPLQLKINGLRVSGFEWLPAEGNYTQTVLICHGFDSSSYKFDKFISPLIKSGARVLAFDAPGHGNSDGKTINALLYRNLILQIEKQFGPLDVVMAHSLGGLAASLAMEQMTDQQKKKLILIAPATETSRAVHNFYRFIPIHDKIKKEFETLIENIAGNPISWFSMKRSVQHIKAKILWLHDEDDWVCPFEDVKPLIAQQPSHIEFMITKGLGHSKIYRDAASVKKILEFITEQKAE